MASYTVTVKKTVEWLATIVVRGIDEDDVSDEAVRVAQDYDESGKIGDKSVEWTEDDTTYEVEDIEED